MSLDVYLKVTEPHTIYEANITHNLNEMAVSAELYYAIWRPEEVGIKKAGQLIGPLTRGLELLKSDPPRFKALNPENGRGSYEGLVKWVEAYLQACKAHPDAEVSVWR